MKLIAICRERDVALLALDAEDANFMIKNGLTNLTFGDNFNLAQTEEVLTIGYPLGMDNIKFTTGVVSGFQAKVTDTGDYHTDEVVGNLSEDELMASYIQITAPINPGNSGGPVLNSQGQVIGIASAGILKSQNIGYAIGSRSILAILEYMIDHLNKKSDKPLVVKMPRFSFDWNRTTLELIRALTGQDISGIYLSTVYPDSIFDKLESGDILTKITYEDRFFFSEDNFDVTKYGSSSEKSFRTRERSREVDIYIDNYGQIQLSVPCNNSSKELCRQYSLKEIIDTMFIGANITATFYRGSRKYSLDTNYSYMKTDLIQKIYPRFENYKYVIFAGMCVSQLTYNHVHSDSSLGKYLDRKERYKPHLVIDQIFPDTILSKLNIFSEGDVLKCINDKNIDYIDDIYDILNSDWPFLKIKNDDDRLFIISREQDEQDLERIQDNFPYLNLL